MPIAEIITIGTEILLGEIIDTNSRFIARALRDNGIDIYRTTSIGDNVQRISQTIQEALMRTDIIITTGGLGPTVDDPTREAIARAFGVESVFQEKLWQQVIDRFARFDRFPTENNKRQAYIPSNAIAIENPVGTAPAFYVETYKNVVISLPGVPSEMEHLMEHAVLPYLQKRFTPDTILKVRTLHTAGIGESTIDDKIGDLETSANPTVGLAAHSGQVDVRITVKAKSVEEANKLINQMEQEIRNRLGSWVYGADEDNLVDISLKTLISRKWKLVTVEFGTEGKILRQFAPMGFPFIRGEIRMDYPKKPEQLLDFVNEYVKNHGVEVGLGTAIYPGIEKSEIYLALVTPEENKLLRIPYGGPPKLLHRRAVNLCLDFLRKIQ